VPADEVGDPQQLSLPSPVNGETRQDSNTSEMIFSVTHIIWNLSQYLVLDPGDVINTGTPKGVALSGKFPYLREGDRMEISREKLGRQEQKLVHFRK
jgi:2,4-diketo-3-deoxy-L-fuconate hydrolase